ncbi:MAG: hypothetical protein M3Z75_17340 [Actinomycetota bacterium]|nr:hypothetical protein [Actinomycetota bacterium]
MMARQRYGKSRQASMKTRLGLAAAVLAGGGSIAAVGVVATSHPGVTAEPAGYATSSGHEGAALSSVMTQWGQARQSAYSQLAQLTQARQFSQVRYGHRILGVQRGIVVLATRKFLILQSANGSLHLWLLSGATRFADVASTAAGTAALTASTSATQQAMSSGNMIPATTLLAGSPVTAARLLTPTPSAQTVSVQVADTDLTVTVTVVRTMATVSQTATTPLNAAPAPNPVTFRQNAWQATNALARGDLAVVLGSRSHGTLHATLVLFTPLTTGTVGGQAATSTPAVAPTSW